MKDLFFRKAESKDIDVAVALLRDAFKIWEPIGFKTSNFTTELVSSFLVRDGYIAEDAHKNAVAMVCINFEKPKLMGLELSMNRAHRTDTTTLNNPELVGYLRLGIFSYFYSLAVDPTRGKAGIGQKILEFIESESAKKGCKGVLLETGQRTGWLVKWYERFGFKLIGTYTRNNDPLVFMLKKLS